MTALTDAQAEYFNGASPANYELKMGTIIQALQNGAGVDVTTITGDVEISSGKVATIQPKSVTAAKMDLSVSAEQTGTGSSQNVAHGLTGTPSLVLAIPTLNGAAGAFAVTYGTATSTNAVVTVTTGAKFKVLAII